MGDGTTIPPFFPVTSFPLADAALRGVQHLKMARPAVSILAGESEGDLAGIEGDAQFVECVGGGDEAAIQMPE